MDIRNKFLWLGSKRAGQECFIHKWPPGEWTKTYHIWIYYHQVRHSSTDLQYFVLKYVQKVNKLSWYTMEIPQRNFFFTILVISNVHCKPGPFDKQFCIANTAIFASYINFQSNNIDIFNSRQKCEFINLFALLDKLKIFTL
jgi:hypothetical protein